MSDIFNLPPENPNHYLTEFGKLLRGYRIENMMTLKDMADSTNVKPSVLSAYENNRIPITREFITKLDRAGNFGLELMAKLIQSCKYQKLERVFGCETIKTDECRYLIFIDNDIVLEDKRPIFRNTIGAIIYREGQLLFLLEDTDSWNSRFAFDPNDFEDARDKLRAVLARVPQIKNDSLALLDAAEQYTKENKNDEEND